MITLPAPPTVTVGLFEAERPRQLVVSSAFPLRVSSPTKQRTFPPRTRLTFGGSVREIQLATTTPLDHATTWTIEAPGPLMLTTGAIGPFASTRVIVGKVTLYQSGVRQTKITRPKDTPRNPYQWFVHLGVRSEVPFERYITGVLGAEAPADWPNAALTAQAIAARSYTLTRLDEAPHPRFDLCDSTHCARFRQDAPSDARIQAAARASEGQVLAFKGRAAATLWHAACGGETANFGDVYGRIGPAYLAGVGDRRPNGTPWCDADSRSRGWKTDLPRERLTEVLQQAGFVTPKDEERLTDIEVVDRAPSGVVRRLRLTGSHVQTLTGLAFWETLGPIFGWTSLRSLNFAIQPTAQGWHVAGRGLGHGVGMCQAGAKARAIAGNNAQAILAAYYPGTEPALIKFQPRNGFIPSLERLRQRLLGR